MDFPRIAHIITDLDGFGGTEATMLRYLTASGIPKQCHRVIVLKSIGTGNSLGAQMIAAGISVVALNQRGRSMSLRAMRRLHAELSAFAPDIVSGWLYHSCLLASLFSPLLVTRPTIVWHIRSSPFCTFFGSPGRFIAQRLLAILSRVTDSTLVSNSHTAVNSHAPLGFDVRPERWTVIDNGIDTQQYYPGSAERLEVRRELGIPAHALVIGCVGRFVPEKAYDVMLPALEAALHAPPRDMPAPVHFVAMGNGVSMNNAAFAKLLPASLPRDRLHLLEKRPDVPRILRALDVYVLSSVSEAFPNSLAEAMATGLACIATDVGECRAVLGSSDWVVPPGDADRLGQRIVDLLLIDSNDRGMVGDRNRRRIAEHFTLCRMVERLDALFLRSDRMARGAEVKIKRRA